MLLQEVTTILKVLLAAYQPLASQDELTQRRIGQIGEVIGAASDIAEAEEKPNATIAEKRVEEAHDIIHRVAAILAMEEDGNEGDGSDGSAAGADTGPGDDEPLQEVPWDGKLSGETIDLAEDEE